MTRRRATWLAGACVAAALAPPVGGQEPAEDALGLNLDGASFNTFLTLVARVTDRVISHDDDVRARTLHMVGTRRVPSAALWPLAESLAEHQGYGFTVVGAGTPHELYKLVPALDLHRHPAPVVDADEVRADPARLPDEDRYLALTYRLRHADAKVMADALGVFVDRRAGGRIEAVPDVNAVVITDFAPNVRRLMQILDRLDRPRAGAEASGETPR